MTYRGNTNLFRIDKFFSYKSIWETSKRTNQLDFTAQDIFLETVIRQLLERRGFFIPTLLIFRFHNEIFIKLFFLKIKGYQKYLIRKKSRDLDYRYRKLNNAKFKISNNLKKTQTLLLLNLLNNNIFYKKYTSTYLYKYKNLQKHLKKIQKYSVSNYNSSNFSKQELIKLAFNKLSKHQPNKFLNVTLYKKNILKYIKNSFFKNTILNNKKNIIKEKHNSINSQNYIIKKNLSDLKLINQLINPLLTDLKKLQNITYPKTTQIKTLQHKYNMCYNIKNFYIGLYLKIFNKNLNLNIPSIIYKNNNNITSLILLKNFIKKNHIIFKKHSNINTNNIYQNYYIKLTFYYNLILKNVNLNKNLKEIPFYLSKILFLSINCYQIIYNKYQLNTILLQKSNNQQIKLNFETILKNYSGVNKIRFQYYHFKPLIDNVNTVFNKYYEKLTFVEKIIFNKFFKTNSKIILTKKNFLFFYIWLKKFETIKTNNNFSILNLLTLKTQLLFILKKRNLLTFLFQNTKLNKYKAEPYYKDTLKIFAHIFFNKKASAYLLIRFISFQFRILNRKKQRKFLTFLKRICEHFEIHPLFKAHFALKLRIKGRIGGKPRKKTFKIETSKLFLTEIDNVIETNTLQAYSRYGSYGISIWIRRSDLYSKHTEQIISKKNITYKNF